MSSNKQLLTCTLCLDVFRKPKILPCFHTYCEECLRDLAARQGGRTFPCPNCRKTVAVPNGGVTAFQTNFYIDSAELKREKRKFTCTTHAQNDLVSFCSSCDQAICVECLLQQHKTHDIHTFAQKAKTSTDQLCEDKERLNETERSLQMRMARAKQNRETLQDKVEEVKTEIKTRYAQLVSKAEKRRDEELAKVDALANELDTTEADAKVAEMLQEKCQSLKESLAAVKNALDRGDDFGLVMAAKKMREEKRRVQAMVPEQNAFYVPALHAEDVADNITRTVSAVIGHVTTNRISRTEFSWRLIETVKCSRPNIHCLSVLESEDICVSYEQGDAPVQRFNKHGVLVDIASSLAGKVTFNGSIRGECLYVLPQEDKQVLSAKFNHPYIIQQDMSGQNVVKKVDVKSKKTLTTEWTEVFTFTSSGTLVAFDVDANESKFAVIEESGQDAARSLKIYLMSNSEPAFSFSLKSFQPSDCCFYIFQGKEVCLLADETHDSVRLFKVEEGSMLTFISQTGTLNQPTALNTDRKERLWIGCRDGRIFRCEP